MLPNISLLISASVSKIQKYGEAFQEKKQDFIPSNYSQHPVLHLHLVMMNITVAFDVHSKPDLCKFKNLQRQVHP